MKEILKLYKNGSPFPSSLSQIELLTYEYDAVRMSTEAPSITDTVKWETCLDDVWGEGVYTIYKGEKYYLKGTPTSYKNTDDERYVHELELRSERDMLNHIFFIDAVQGDSGIDVYQSNNTKVNFYGDINEFVARLNSAMQYAKVPYSVRLAEGISTEALLVSFEDKYLSEALQEIYNIYKLPYYFDGYEVVVGASSDVITEEMAYGFTEALLEARKENGGFDIINRCTGVGSSDNIPYYYPNDSEKGVLSVETGGGLSSSNVEITNPELYGKEVSLTDVLEYKDYITDASYNTSAIYMFDGFTEDMSSVPFTKRQYVFLGDKLSYTARGSMTINFSINLDGTLNIPVTDDITVEQSKNVQIQKTYTLQDFTTAETRTVSNVSGKIQCGKVKAGHIYILTCSYSISDTWQQGDNIPTATYINLTLSYSFANTCAVKGWFKGDLAIDDLSDVGLLVNASPVKGNTIVQKADKIPYAQTLMPPVYRESKSAERFYNAKNDTYLIPNSSEYYKFENLYSDANRREGKSEFDDIKPTIKGTTNASGARIDLIKDVAFDLNDNNETEGDSEGTFKHPYFFVKLNRFDGDFGFNLFNQSLESGTMQLSLTSGVCSSCTFEIMVDENTQDNRVQVDSSGNLMRDENGNVLFGAAQTRQNDTRNNEVWIALKKDTQTQGVTLPDKIGNIIPSAGDSFVLLNILMPKSYILKAEKELEDAIIDYMYQNNVEKFNFSINFSRIYLAENKAIADRLNENVVINLKYNNHVIPLYVTNYSYKWSENDVLPEISVELSTEVSVSNTGIKKLMSDIEDNFARKLTDVGTIILSENRFIRKDVADVANNDLTFNGNLSMNGRTRMSKGVTFGNYQQGFLGAGGAVEIGEDGSSSAEFDFLNIRRKATFNTIEVQEQKHIGGQFIVSNAAMVCSRVINYNDFYRCYFKTEDADGRALFNEFVVDDQARSQIFNLQEGQNRYYWRLVVGIGKDYIDLSATDADTGSDIPMAGDSIVQLGNRTDKERQSAQILSSFGDKAPSYTQYEGIDSYSLEGKMVTELSPKGNTFTGKMVIKAGSTGVANFDDLPEEIGKAVSLGSVNLVRNSGFLGGSDTVKLFSNTALVAKTPLGILQLMYWKTTGATVVDDEESATGKACQLGQISQNIEVIEQERYVFSMLAKGTKVTVSIGDNSTTFELSGTYKLCTFTVRHMGSTTLTIKGADCTVCDIQVERGTIRTDWKPSPADNMDSLAELEALKYLSSAIKDADTTILGGLILTAQLLLGNYINGAMQRVTAGVNGIFNKDTDVAFFAGGSLEQAIRAVQELEQNPEYEGTDIANFVATHGGKAYLKDAIIRGTIYASSGKFKGTIEATDGYFSGLIMPTTTTVTDDNIMNYIDDNSRDEYNGKIHYQLDFSRLGRSVIISKDLTKVDTPVQYKGETVYIDSILTVISQYQGIFTPSYVNQEIVTRWIGQTFYLRNENANLWSITGFVAENEEGLNAPTGSTIYIKQNNEVLLSCGFGNYQGKRNTGWVIKSIYQTN